MAKEYPYCSTLLIGIAPSYIVSLPSCMPNEREYHAAKSFADSGQCHRIPLCADPGSNLKQQHATHMIVY